MSSLRLTILAFLSFVLSGCFVAKDEAEVFRGKRNGRPFQKVVVTQFDGLGTKLGRIIQDYEYHRPSKSWVPIGAPRNFEDGDSEAELENLQGYQGNESNPPSAAAVTIPSYLYLANNSGDNKITVLNANTLVPVARILVPGFMNSLAASPDGRTVAVPSANQLLFIDVLTNRVTRSVALPPRTSIKSIHYSTDGTRLFLSDFAAGIRVFDVATASLLATIPLPSGYVQLDSSAMSPDGDFLFVRVGGPSSTLIFDITTLTFTTGANTGRAILFSDIPCAFHSTGKEIYCLAVDGIAILDAATMTLSGTINLPRNESVYRFYPVDGGDYLVYTAANAVRMLDPQSRQILATLTPGPNRSFTTAYPVSIF